jgi:hypothetical protein
MDMTIMKTRLVLDEKGWGHVILSVPGKVTILLM